MKSKLVLVVLSLGLGLSFIFLFLSGLGASPAQAEPLACTAGPHSGSMTESQTWCVTDNPHIVNGNLTVNSGYTLTLDAGVVVKFNSGTGITVNGGGTLYAVGTDTQPITLTSSSASPLPGDWGRIVANDGSRLRLSYCDISYGAGTGSYGAIAIQTSDVLIDHCTIHHMSPGYAAILLSAAGISPTIQHTTIRDNSNDAIRQSTPDMTPVYRDLTFSGNGTDAVVLGGGTINQNVTLDGRELHGKPFMAYNLNVGQALTLTAGTNLVFYEGSLNVLSGARLTLDGSPTEPVTLTSAALNDWKGIKLNSGTSARLSYCDISNSGGSGNYGTIDIQTSDVLVDHCTIHNTNPGYGAILLSAAGISPTIQHTTIRDNSNDAIRQSTPDMTPVYRDLTFSGNGTDAVVLGGTTVINQNVTLDGRELHGKPFMAYNLNVGQALTLTAGTNLVFYEGSLNVLSGARLTLDGSPTEPVTLTSAALNDWKGIKVSSGGHARLSYCDISNSGGSGSNGTIEILASDILVDHCNIHNTNPGYGAILLNAMGISPTIQHTTIRDNSTQAIRQYSPNMAPVYHDLTFSGNGVDDIGIYQFTGTSISAGRNWDFSEANVPVRLYNNITINANGYLALGEGTKLEMITGTGLIVDGGLYAFGTYTAPITITGVHANPGVWGGINIRNGSKAILQFCNLEYGGRSNTPQLTISSSEVAVQNCRIHHSVYDGIQVNNNKQPALTYNQIENNTTYGLRNATPATVVNAVYNWWGSTSGPYHASLNPSGTGNQVSNGVTFMPFLTTPQYTGIPPVGDIQVELFGPKRVIPGRAAEYAVWYSNLTGATLHNATLVLVLPYTARMLDSTGGGVFWPQRHHVFWKLGDLAPGAQGGVSARVRYKWGTPLGTLDAAQVFMLGQEQTQSQLRLEDYLEYDPIQVVQEIALTPAQFSAELATSPNLATLYGRLTGRGFTADRYSQVIVAGGDPAVQALLTKPDLTTYAYLQRRGNTVVAVTFDRNSMSIETVNSSANLPLVLPPPAPAVGSVTALDKLAEPSLAPSADLSIYECLMNCAIENVGTAILAEFVKPLGVLGNISSCVDYFATSDATAKAGCISSLLSDVPGVGVVMAITDCLTQFVADPNSCKCTEAKWESASVIKLEACKKTPCNTSRGVYEPSQADFYFCPFCQRCIAGLGGSSSPADHCKPCNEGPPEECIPKNLALSQSPAGPQSITAGGGFDCKKNCLQAALDPNAKYGHAGDVLPGQRITYTITYENVGQGEAYGVFITDPLDEHFDPDTLVISGTGKYLAPTRTILWTIGQVAAKGEAGSQGVVTFTVQLKPDIPAGTVIMNQAVVHFASVPEDTATNPVVNVVQPLSALPQQVETTYMQLVAITLEGEGPGGPLTYSVERQPFYGELSGSAPNLVYTPAEDFTGQDLFTFQVSDALTTSRPADVEIIVLPSAADSKPPTVLWTDPVSGTTGVTVYPRPVLTDTLGPAYLPYVSARFSEQISQTNLTTATFLLQDRQGYLINSSVSFNPQTYQGILAPRQPLTPFNWYTATLTTGITDLIGNPLLQEYVWRFFALPQNTLFLPVVRR